MCRDSPQASPKQSVPQKGCPSSALSMVLTRKPHRQWLRPAETQVVCHMQQHYKGQCLTVAMQALIVHGTHRELEPFKPVEDIFFSSASCSQLTFPLETSLF